MEELVLDVGLPGLGAFDLGKLLADVVQVELEGFDLAEPALVLASSRRARVLVWISSSRGFIAGATSSIGQRMSR